MIRKDRARLRRTEKEIATLRVFESLATPEMIQIRDALLPAVLAWEEGLDPSDLRLRGPARLSRSAQVRQFVKEHPWRTPSEIAKESGLERNLVSRVCSDAYRKGLLQRESTNTTDRSGLTIWRYACPGVWSSDTTARLDADSALVSEGLSKLAQKMR
jgi:hypothetical protein